MKIGPQILRCKHCNSHPVFTVTQRVDSHFEIVLWCDHQKLAGSVPPMAKITAISTHKSFGTYYAIHDWNWIYGKGIKP